MTDIESRFSPHENEANYRHELKYLISSAQAVILKSRMDHLAPLDYHAAAKGSYQIRSLYFDDYTNRCFWENENGTDPREKFRIRIYNHDIRQITLECKRKERGKTLKTACPLTLEQTQVLMSGNTLPDFAGQPPLLKKLTGQMMTRRLHPVVIVEYNRIPYVYHDGNVRITLDSGIRSCASAEKFLDEVIPCRPVLPVGQQLLEVKFDAFLPDFLYRSLQLNNLSITTFSKYYLCRKYTR